MCSTCGCASGELRIEGVSSEHSHHHSSDDASPHSHSHIHDHSHGLPFAPRRLIDIEMDVLAKNNHIAAHNREHFAQASILALNLVSSPGSGKTTLLTSTLTRLALQFDCAVVEGDQQTTNDADRIRATGVPAIQVNTGKGCHLDAQMVHDAVHQLAPKNNSLLFIENVGNLVCPASFDIGQHRNVLLLSVTEGDDKPAKYPIMFRAGSQVLITKTDLLPYIEEFSMARARASIRAVRGDMPIIELSSKNGNGMAQWIDWLVKSVAERKAEA